MVVVVVIRGVISAVVQYRWCWWSVVRVVVLEAVLVSVGVVVVAWYEN